MDEGRYRFATDGENSMVILCIRKVKPNDEGSYKIVATNKHGEAAEECELLVSGQISVSVEVAI